MNFTLCTGMIRSGSTWSFNVCRILNQMKAMQESASCQSMFADYKELEEKIYELKDKPDNDYLTIKTHVITQNILNLLVSKQLKINNICTLRDPRDCITSSILFHDQTIEYATTSVLTSLGLISMYATMNNTLFIRYENMIQDPRPEIKKIADHLGMDCAENIIERIHQDTSMERSEKIAKNIKNQPENTYYKDRDDLVDTLTLLHDGHLNGGEIGRWKEGLNQKQKDYVHKALKNWLVFLGYEAM